MISVSGSPLALLRRVNTWLADQTFLGTVNCNGSATVSGDLAVLGSLSLAGKQIQNKAMATAWYTRGVAHGSIADAFNISTVTVMGSGAQYRIYFDVPMDNTDYCILSFAAQDDRNLGSVARVQEKNINYVELWIVSGGFEFLNVVIFGGKN